MDTQIILFSLNALGAGIAFGSIVHAAHTKNWPWIPVLLFASVLGQHPWVSALYLILYWILEIFPKSQNEEDFQDTQNQETIYRWLRINSLEKQVSVYPWPHLIEELSQLLEKENRYSEAAQYCRKALSLNQSSISLRFQLSKNLMHRQQVEEAYTILAPVLDRNEDLSFEMKALVAEILEKLDRLEDAAVAWKLLVENSHRSLARFQLARVLSRLGRTQEAEQTLHELAGSSTIDPSVFGKTAHEDTYWILKGRQLLESISER